MNNAGYSLLAATEETSIEEARALFETNFFGTLQLTQAVLPIMRGQGNGSIANINSVLGFLPTQEIRSSDTAREGLRKQFVLEAW